MLRCSELLTCDKYVQINDVSLELYREFGETVLMKRRFHYFFEDNTDIIVEFQEYGIRHMLGIHHIDSSVSKNNFFNEIKDGLSFDSFKITTSMSQRFKKMKPRIRLFSCTYNTLRCGRVFYCPNREVINSNNTKMDYIIYREIDTKGFNIGIRFEDGVQVPLTILVDGESRKEEHIDPSKIKIVKQLLITDIETNNIIENILYSNSFITSNGIK